MYTRMCLVAAANAWAVLLTLTNFQRSESLIMVNTRKNKFAENCQNKRFGFEPEKWNSDVQGQKHIR